MTPLTPSERGLSTGLFQTLLRHRDQLSHDQHPMGKAMAENYRDRGLRSVVHNLHLARPHGRRIEEGIWQPWLEAPELRRIDQTD